MTNLYDEPTIDKLLAYLKERDERIRELEQALQSEVECTEIKLKGASERALMVLDSKNHFADKCRDLEQQLTAAQERLAEAEELLQGMLECGELLPLLTKDYFAKRSKELG